MGRWNLLLPGINDIESAKNVPHNDDATQTKTIVNTVGMIPWYEQGLIFYKVSILLNKVTPIWPYQAELNSWITKMSITNPWISHPSSLLVIYMRLVGWMYNLWNNCHECVMWLTASINSCGSPNIAGPDILLIRKAIDTKNPKLFPGGFIVKRDSRYLVDWEPILATDLFPPTAYWRRQTYRWRLYLTILPINVVKGGGLCYGSIHP